MAFGMLQELAKRGYDPTDPRVQMILNDVNRNPNMLPQTGLTWEQLIALNNEVKRLRQPPAQAPVPQTVADRLEGERDQLEGIAQFQLPGMFEGKAYAGGGIVAFQEGNLVRSNRPGYVIDPTTGEERPMTMQELRTGQKQSTDESESTLGMFGRSLLQRIQGTPEDQAAAQRRVELQRAIGTLTPGLFEQITPESRAQRQQAADYYRGLLTGAPSAPTPASTVPPATAPAPAAKPTPQVKPATTPAARAPASQPIKPAEEPLAAPDPAPLSSALMAAQARAFAARQGLGSEESAIEKREKMYEERGIGKADAERKAQLEKREADYKDRMDIGNKFALAGAFFDMAREASRPGQPGGALVRLLGSAAAGGESYVKRANELRSRYEDLQDKLQDSRYQLAQVEEARKAGVIKEGSAEYQNNLKNVRELEAAADKTQTQLAEFVVNKDFQEYLKRLDIGARAKESAAEIASRERIANLAYAGREGDVRRAILAKYEAAKTPAEKARLIEEYRPLLQALGMGKEGPLENVNRVIGSSGLPEGVTTRRTQP